MPLVDIQVIKGQRLIFLASGELRPATFNRFSSPGVSCWTGGQIA